MSQTSKGKADAPTVGWPETTQRLLELRGYTDFAQIGYGSYSTVFRALKTNKTKPSEPPVKVAIKYISLYTTSDNYKNKFFPRELEATRTLRNPHLVPIHEIITEKTGMRYFVVMELCKSDLLHEVEVQTRIPEDRGRIWCRQIVEGLLYLHSKLWVHRDMKIENILINFQNDALVSDFTFMRQQRPNILSNTFCGSLQYAAPEILSADKNYDGFRADIWSTGIIMFAIHSGCMPVVNESDPVLIRQELLDIQHRIKTGMGAPALSHNLRDLLSRMLQLDPKARLPLKEVLKHPWFTDPKLVVGHLVVPASPEARTAKTVNLPRVRNSNVFVQPAKPQSAGRKSSGRKN